MQMRAKKRSKSTSSTSRAADTPGRPRPRSATRLNQTKLLVLASIGLIALGCDPVEYDFSYDASPPDPGPSGTICEDLGVATADCQALTDTDTGCLDEVIVSTKVIAEPAGCTVADLPLGIVSFETPAFPVEADVFAWIVASDQDPGPFDPISTLALFHEKCSSNPFFAFDESACDREPWLAKQGVTISEPLFMHLETASVADATIGFQIRRSDPVQWMSELPPGGEPLSCVYLEQLSDAIVLYTWWLPGPPVPVAVADMAPAWGNTPWICPNSAGGWRQVGFHLYHSDDSLVRVTRVHVRDPSDGQAIDHHFAIYRCNSGGEADPDVPGPLAWDCNDEGDHLSKEFDVTLDPWGGWEDFETNYVLVLQVPPTIGPSLEIEFDAEVL
jgi:hypothetical protein